MLSIRSALALFAMAVVMMLMAVGGVSAQDEFPTTNESTAATTTSRAHSSSSYFVSPGTISDNGLPWPMNQHDSSSMLTPNVMSAVFFAIGGFFLVALF